MSLSFRVWNPGITSFKETPQQPFDPVNACPHHSSSRINQLLGLKLCLHSEPALRPQAGLAGAFRFSELGHGLRLLATADAGSLAGLVARALSVGPAGGCQGEPQAWPPNKLKEKKCIGSILLTDLTNLKSKGLLPPGAFPTPGPLPPRAGTGSRANYHIRNWSACPVSVFQGTSLEEACSLFLLTLEPFPFQRGCFPVGNVSICDSPSGAPYPECHRPLRSSEREGLSRKTPVKDPPTFASTPEKRPGEWGVGSGGRGKERKGREGGGEEVRVLFLQ